MIAELNVAHAYVAGGDWRCPERPGVALPGARFALDTAAGRYRIAEIFQGQNEEDALPLAADRGRRRRPRSATTCWRSTASSSRPTDNPYRLLRDKADRPVTLTLNTKPRRTARAQVTFRPIGQRGRPALPRLGERQPRAGSTELSDGRVGYLHMPDMGADGHPRVHQVVLPADRARRA